MRVEEGLGVRCHALDDSLAISTINLNYVNVDRTCNTPTGGGRVTRLLTRTISVNCAFFSATRICNAPSGPRSGRRLINTTLGSCRSGVILTAGFNVRFSVADATIGGPLIPSSHPRIVHTSMSTSLGQLNASRVSLCCRRQLSPGIPVRRITNMVTSLVQRNGVAR